MTLPDGALPVYRGFINLNAPFRTTGTPGYGNTVLNYYSTSYPNSQTNDLVYLDRLDDINLSNTEVTLFEEYLIRYRRVRIRAISLRYWPYYRSPQAMLMDSGLDQETQITRKMPFYIRTDLAGHGVQVYHINERAVLDNPKSYRMVNMFQPWKHWIKCKRPPFYNRYMIPTQNNDVGEIQSNIAGQWIPTTQWSTWSIGSFAEHIQLFGHFDNPPPSPIGRLYFKLYFQFADRRADRTTPPE